LVTSQEEEFWGSASPLRDRSEDALVGDFPVRLTFFNQLQGLLDQLGEQVFVQSAKFEIVLTQAEVGAVFD